MVGHAFWVDECYHNLHEIDGWNLTILHQCICGGVFRWHIDLQLELGRAPSSYLIGPSNPATTQAVCQFGEMHFWHDLGSVSGKHYWWIGGACGSSQDPSHSGLAISNHSDRALQLPRSCQLLPQVRVGIFSYHLALESSHQGRSERKILLVWISTEGITELKHRLSFAPVLTLPDLQ